MNMCMLLLCEFIRVCLRVRMCLRVCLCMGVCVRERVCACARARLFVHKCIYMYLHMNQSSLLGPKCTYSHMCVFECVFMCWCVNEKEGKNV